ncbi:MAG TPA: hypothetical protein VIK91_00615, partial [Nannocystis sp.]
LLLDGAAGRGSAGLLQYSDVTPWRGKRVRLRGVLRVDPAGDPETSAGLWLRVERPFAEHDLVELDGPDRVTQDTWTVREVSIEIPADAALLALGVDLSGKGKVYADSLDLDVVPQP